MPLRFSRRAGRAVATGDLTLARSLVLWLALAMSLGIVVVLGIRMRKLAADTGILSPPTR